MVKLTPHPCSQGERFVALDLSMKYMKEKVDNIESDVKGINEKLDGMIEKMENHFASKRVEKAVSWLIVALCWGFVTALIKLVIR